MSSAWLPSAVGHCLQGFSPSPVDSLCVLRLLLPLPPLRLRFGEKTGAPWCWLGIRTWALLPALAHPSLSRPALWPGSSVSGRSCCPLTPQLRYWSSDLPPFPPTTAPSPLLQVSVPPSPAPAQRLQSFLHIWAAGGQLRALPAGGARALIPAELRPVF